MQAKSCPKILLLSVNFEKFTSMNDDRDQSQPSGRLPVSGRGPRLLRSISKS